MDKERIKERIKEIRRYLREIEEGADVPAIERYARMADIYCSLLESHVDEEKELWN